MKYKFTVVPTSVGIFAGYAFYSFINGGSTHAGALTFGMITMLVLFGMSKQAEWF